MSSIRILTELVRLLQFEFGLVVDDAIQRKEHLLTTAQILQISVHGHISILDSELLNGLPQPGLKLALVIVP